MLMILARLDRVCFETVVVCPSQGPLPAMAAACSARVETVEGLEARFTWRPELLFRYLKSFYDIIAQLRQKVIGNKPDLIHANSIRSGLVATAATLGLRTPVVWHLHDLLPRHPLSTAIRFFAMLSRRTRMIAVSQAVAVNFRGAFLPLEKRISVILNAIELERFYPNCEAGRMKRAELGLNESEVVLGIVGQLTPRKGQLELLRAFAASLNEVPSATLLIVGAPLFNGDGEYEKRLKATVRELGIAASVRMLGARSDVPAIMQSLDLLVINSSAEPFGLVAVEAMACGTAVLATATGGLPEIIDHDRTGWLVPVKDERSLAAAIVNLARQPALRARLADQARKSVGARFDADRFMNELRALYKRSEPDTGRAADLSEQVEIARLV
ncbi:MAG: glycosyl transferase group 1 [Acidobacteria bacterium]|nr:glycosyl transferase group 1 [Acidobacteriota bacterium]